MLFVIIICLVLTFISETGACVGKPIQYVIYRINIRGIESFDVIQSVITNREPASSIKIEENVKVLCKSLLDITGDTHYFIVNGGLEEIEPGTFENQAFTQALHLSNNKLKIIKSGTFRNLLISDIDLSENQISFIEEKAFDNLKNLRILNLSKNKLAQLPLFGFTDTPSVTSLNLDFNLIKKMEPEMLMFMTKNDRIVFSISANLVEDIHYKVFENLHVVNMNFSHNSITQIPDNIMKNPEVEIVDFSFNKLTRLPETFYSYLNLSKVYLQRNKLDCHTQDELRKFSDALNIYILYDASSC